MNHALQNEDVELWHVEVAPNDVRVVTLEQLDEAFQKGLVNERTRVFQDGMDEPALLGELLGLGEDDEQDEEQEPVQAAPPPQPASRNHQNTLVGLAAEPPRAPAPAARPPTEHSHARPLQSAPPPAASYRPQAAPHGASQRPHGTPPPIASYQQQAAPSQRPQPAVSRRPPPPAEGAWPPVVTRSAPPMSNASGPPSSVSGPSTMTAVVAPSVVPMAMDLGDDDFDYPRPKRKGKVVVATLGVLAVAAAVGLVVTGRGASVLGSLTASAAQPTEVAKAKPAPKLDTVSHAYDPGNAPVKLKDTPDPVVITTRENEATQLAAAGMTAGSAAEASTLGAKSAPAAKSTAKKAAVSAKHAKSSAGPAPTRHGGGGGGKQPFKSGGDTHDPLNGSL